MDHPFSAKPQAQSGTTDNRYNRGFAREEEQFMREEIRARDDDFGNKNKTFGATYGSRFHTDGENVNFGASGRQRPGARDPSPDHDFRNDWRKSNNEKFQDRHGTQPGDDSRYDDSRYDGNRHSDHQYTGHEDAWKSQDDAFNNAFDDSFNDSFIGPDRGFNRSGRVPPAAQQHGREDRSGYSYPGDLRYEVRADAFNQQALHQFSAQQNQHQLTMMKMLQETDRPKLTVEPFDGDPYKFQQFWENFISSVDSNTRVSEEQKLVILKQNLTGKARRLADQYLQCAQNYKIVLQKLYERFNNNQFRLTELLNRIRGFQNVSNHDLDTIENLNNKVQEFYSFVCYTYPEKLFSAADYYEIIAARCPPKVTDPAKNRKTQRENNNIEDTLERGKMCFHDIVVSLNDYTVKLIKKEQDQECQGLSRYKNQYATFNQATENCAFCNGTHLTYKCNANDIRLAAKREIIVTKKLCYRCLKPWESGHGNVCKISCGKCKGNHNTLVCQASRSQSRDRPRSQQRSSSYNNQSFSNNRQRSGERARSSSARGYRRDNSRNYSRDRRSRRDSWNQGRQNRSSSNNNRSYSNNNRSNSYNNRNSRPRSATPGVRNRSPYGRGPSKSPGPNSYNRNRGRSGSGGNSSRRARSTSVQFTTSAGNTPGPGKSSMRQRSGSREKRTSASTVADGKTNQTGRNKSPKANRSSSSK